MSRILEVLPSRSNLTDSSYCFHEWFDFIDQGEIVAVHNHFDFPDLYSSLVERPDDTWELVNGDTSASGRYGVSSEWSAVDSIESPVVSPRKKLKVIVKVTQLKKGKPSVCDEVGW